MAKTVRQVIHIDEHKCNGCGVCVPACVEGALQIVEGKARLVSETYCDGLGACLGECPQGAISFETREAEEFDEAAAVRHAKSSESAAPETHNHSHAGFVCPSARTIDRTREASVSTSAPGEHTPSELRQWPLKLALVNPSASYFQDADLLLAADCVAFAYGSFHTDFLRGKTLIAGCPKFDDVESYAEKLSAILSANTIRSITVVQMEVPCCSGMQRLAEYAVETSGKEIPVEVVCIGIDGSVKSACPV